MARKLTFDGILRMDAEWQHHLRAQGIDPDQFPTYDQPCPDGRTVRMRAYPDKLKVAFHKWVEETYIPRIIRAR